MSTKGSSKVEMQNRSSCQQAENMSNSLKLVRKAAGSKMKAGQDDS